MNKTRWMLAATLVLVLAGLGFGLMGVISKLSVSAESNPLPKAVSYLPQEADVVAYVDVRRLVYSPAFKEFEKEHGNQFTYKLQEFINETGLDPRQDIDSIAFAATPGVKPSGGVAIITGKFDKAKIENLLLTKGQAATTTYFNHKLYTNPRKEQNDMTQEVGCFLDDTNLAFGQLRSVQETLDVYRGARYGINGNVAFNQLLSQTKTDGTFWLVTTNTSFMSHFSQRKEIPGQVQQSIPQIQNFIIEGDLGNIVTATLRSRCTDEKAAQNLGDFLRGLVALGKMVTAQNPQLAGLLEDVRVGQDKTLVTIEISVPFEDLKKLKEIQTREKLQQAIKTF